MLQPALLAGWILAVVFRVVFFREGGELGAYACSAVFAAATVGLIILSAVRLTERRQGETLQAALILGAMLALIFRFLVDGPAASIGAWVFFLCTVGLVVAYLRRGLSRIRSS